MSADTSMWSSDAWSSAADAYLLARSREGSAEAFGELWRRHLPAAYAVAHRYRGRTSAEDVVAEAATRVFALVREGRGPQEHFRAYFLAAVRTVALDAHSRDLHAVPADHDDLEALAEPALDVEPPGDDTVELVRQAFRELPERDQRVLWHTTVEGSAPRNVAPVLGMTANAVSVRAMRARDALRARFLDARAAQGLPGADDDECRWTVRHLGALVRGRLTRRQAERAEAHLADCPRAAALAAELRELHEAFPALIVPLVLAAGVSTPGFVGSLGIGALVGAASAAPAASAASGAPAATGQHTQDALGEVASRAASLLAVGVMAVATLAGPGDPVSGPLPAAARPASTSTLPASSSTVVASSPTAQTSGPSTTTASPTATTAPVSRTTRVRAVATTTASPATTRAVRQGNAVITAQLLNGGSSSTFALRVRSDVGGTLSVTVANASGAGRLTVGNSAWTCTQASTSSVRCSGDGGGRVLLTQSGLGGLTPVVVTVVDASGATTTRTVRPS